MIPKEKAIELYRKMEAEFSFAVEYGSTKSISKNLAEICVDEILNINSVDKDCDLYDYWDEVKQEINKI